MPELLSRTAGFEEVVWNLAHFEDRGCITLQDNPHFYSELPTSLDAYTPQFKASPVDNSELKPNATIYVLVDQRRRVFLETRRETPNFGNIFTPQDAVIFKGSSNVLSIPCGALNISLDIHGALEGGSVVAESIKGISTLWHSEKFFVVPHSSTSAYDFSSLPIVTANPTTKRTSQDRICLIRNTLGSGDKDFHIYAGQLLPLWSTRKMVRYDKSGLRMPHIDHASIRYRPHTPHHQHPSDLDDDWSLQLRWCKLSRVCQKWRNVLHRSSCRLGMHVPFTSCTCPFDILAHLPPLPIVVNCHWD